MNNIFDILGDLAYAYGEYDEAGLDAADEAFVAYKNKFGDETSDFDGYFDELDGEVDFRIYVRPEGNWEIITGDASYDTDHRGGCGAGSVDLADRGSIGEAVL